MNKFVRSQGLKSRLDNPDFNLLPRRYKAKCITFQILNVHPLVDNYVLRENNQLQLVNTSMIGQNAKALVHLPNATALQVISKGLACDGILSLVFQLIRGILVTLSRQLCKNISGVWMSKNI